MKRRRSHRIRTPSRHTAKHGLFAMDAKDVHAAARRLLGREYPVTSWDRDLTVNHLSGLVGRYVTGTRGDGRMRTVFVPYGKASGR